MLMTSQVSGLVVELCSRVSDHLSNQRAYLFGLHVPFTQTAFSVAKVLATLACQDSPHVLKTRSPALVEKVL